MIDLIQKLVEAHGPSGFEDGIRDLIRPEVEGLVDELSVDAMGNLIATRHATEGGSPQTVMVAAHMDEIGIMVSHITEHGFLRFTNIGGVFPHTLLGRRVQFSNGIVGIIGADRMESREQIHPLSKHFIDVGAASRDDVPVKVGDVATFIAPFIVQGSRLTAKSMDDRIACAIAIEALRRLDGVPLPHNLHVVFSVQEEVGVRGAEAAAGRLEPDIGIAVDVTLTGDLPEARPMEVALGAGPAIKVKDSGMIAHAGLVRLMRRRAEESDLAYQLEVLEGGSTDARAMQVAGPGSAAGCISIPCRYVHTQSETVDQTDVEGAVTLLVALLSQPMDLHD